MQLTNHLLLLKADVVDNRNISDRCICRKGLHLNFSRATQLADNFAIFFLNFSSVKGYSGMSNLIPEPGYPLTLYIT